MMDNVTPITPETFNPSLPDPELQPYLARDSRKCLIHLLSTQPRGELVNAHELAAVLTLIDQAHPPLA